jgi:hypothetical protein
VDYIDKQELAEECLTIIKELHELGAPKETKDLNRELLNSFPTYVRFMKKDLKELVRLSWELRAELDRIR